MERDVRGDADARYRRIGSLRFAFHVSRFIKCCLALYRFPNSFCRDFASRGGRFARSLFSERTIARNRIISILDFSLTPFGPAGTEGTKDVISTSTLV